MSSSSSSSPPPPPWIDLPQEITSVIFQKVGAVELLLNVQIVCKTWRKICKEPATWRVIDMRNDYDFPYDMEKICLHAVDLSQGQLIDLNIEFFGSDELLAYIAERSSQLRRLRIVSGFALFGYMVWINGLSEACKKFPLLEELHIFFCQYILGESIKAIGHSCPLLRSFKLNRGYAPIINNEEALAIASSMPRLRYLQLYGNTLSNEGVTAILNGCPDLESLDLRKCRFVYLDDELSSRCSQQIKDWRPPHDNPEDYEYYNPSTIDESVDPNGFSDMDLMSEDSCFNNVYTFSDTQNEDSGDEDEIDDFGDEEEMVSTIDYKY